jgi:hypothetical protein
MKKVLALMVGIMLIPGLAFGMEALTVDEMAEITGQSGVAIAMDDVKVFFSSDNEELWWRTEGDFTAVNGKVEDYDASIGLVRNNIGQMLYVNAVMSTDGVNGAAARTLYSPGRPLMGPGTNPDGTPRTYRDYVVNYGFNFGNAKLPQGNAAINGLLAAGFGANWQDYVLYKDTGTALYWYDAAFDSKALTIRVVDKLPIFSEAAKNRVAGLAGVEAALGLPVGSGVIWPAEYSIAYNNGPNEEPKIAGVQIGLPTAEIHYRNPAGETLEILIHANPHEGNPLLRNGNNAVIDANDLGVCDTWSYGILYYGGERSTETIMILDGQLEITPIEAYARPILH